jgi:NADPH2 dehydrogenase
MEKLYPHIAPLKTTEKFKDHLESINVQIPFDSDILPAPEGPLAQPYVLKDGKRIGNRFCIQPMEGWDGTTDGRPTELVSVDGKISV